MIKKFEIQGEIIEMDSLFESMPVAMALIDRDGRHVAINQALASLSGLNTENLIGDKVEKQSKESAENIKRDFLFFDEGRDVPDHEVQINDRIFYVSVKPIRNKSGYAIGEMVALTDITKNKDIEKQLEEANKRLQYLASYDSLTGILNSRTYYEICDKMMGTAHRQNTEYSVLFLDLDHFKSVNDTFGHDAGDFILKEVSACMTKNLRNCDIVGRVGGEEFCIYLPDTNHEGALVIAEKLRSKIQDLKPIFLGNSIHITSSIGVASRLKHHKSIADIQRDADHAMYHAKKEGRNRVSFLNIPCYVEKYLENEVD